VSGDAFDLQTQTRTVQSSQLPSVPFLWIYRGRGERERGRPGVRVRRSARAQIVSRFRRRISLDFRIDISGELSWGDGPDACFHGVARDLFVRRGDRHDGVDLSRFDDAAFTNAV